MSHAAAAALDDPATLREQRDAIAEAYQMAGQKLYVGVCMCDPPEPCRVCDDRPLVAEVV